MVKTSFANLLLAAFCLLSLTLSAGCAKLDTKEELAAAISESGAAARIAISGPTMGTPNQCIPLVMTLQTASGQTAAAIEDLQFTVTGIGSEVYSDDSCVTAKSLPLLMSAGTSSTVLYVKPTLSQNYTLSVTEVSQKITGAYQIIAVSAGSGLALHVSGAASLTTNVCSPYVVMTVDVSGNSLNVPSNLLVTVSGGGSGVFYSDAGCSVASSAVTISTGTSLGYVYFQAASAQNLVFAANATGASTGTFPLSIVSGAGGGGAAKLAWSGSGSPATNVCIPYVLSLTDASGNSVNAAANTAVTLSGSGAGVFYTDAACSISAAGTTSITSGTSYNTLYFQSASAQNLIFVAQATGLSNGTMPIAVTAPGGGAVSGPAVKLTFIAQPSSAATVSVNLSTQPIVVVQDSNNNVVSAATNAITLQAYSDSACTILAGGALNASVNPVSAIGGSASFAGVNQTNAQGMYLRASAAGLASACSGLVQVYPSVPARLVFSQQPSVSVVAGVNLATQPQVSVLNYTGQVMTAATNPITLAAFTDSACTVAATGTMNVTTNPTLPSSGIATFAGVNYSSATTIYLRAQTAGLTSACSTGITVSPAAAASLTFYTAPPSSVVAGASFSAQVRLLDAFGNIAPVTDTIQLTAYATSNCGGSVLAGFSNNSAAAVLGTASFATITETVSGTMSIRATNTTNGAVTAACTGAIAVSNATATTLSFTVQPSSTGFIYANLLTSPVVTVTDTYGNIATLSSAMVTLAAYTDNTCTTTAAPGTFGVDTNPMPPNAGNVNFSGVNYSAAATIYIRATASGLTTACSSAVVIGGTISQIATGGAHSCALSNGNVFCWGANDTGQLGNGTIAGAVHTPVQVLGVGGVGVLTNIIGISASGQASSGGAFTCAVNSSGDVFCWGANYTGQLGNNTTTASSTPVQVRGVSNSGTLANITKISAGGSGYGGHACAVNTGGSAFCWGFNDQSQLGDNTTTQRNTPVQVRGVANVGTLANIVDISAAGGSTTSTSYSHTCAVNSTGAAYCWGYNGNNQLGDTTATLRATPVQVVGVGGTGFLANVTQISATTNASATGFTCAVTSGGSVYCWGNNGAGQLGDNSTTTRSAPVQVVGVGGTGFLASIAKVTTGHSLSSYGHSCAITTTGLGFCWGYGGYGQLGNASGSNSNTPLAIIGVGGTGTLQNLIGISSSSGSSQTVRTCAVDSLGSVYCWGQRASGGIGDGSTTTTAATQNSPVKVWASGAVNYSQIVTSGYHSCGLLSGNVYCWGQNNTGQLGIGNNTNMEKPTPVVGVGGSGVLSNIIQISVGHNYYSSGYGSTCAVHASGAVYCWGDNSNYQLGDGTNGQKTSPVQVSGLSGAIKVSVGGSYYGHTCAVTSAGAVWCWGSNGYGQIGDGTTAVSRSLPLRVLGVGGTGYLANIVDISAASQETSDNGTYGYTCAVSSSGKAFCWGANGTGQLGDSTSTQRTYPVEVSNLSNVLQIDTAIYGANSGHTCAVTTSGNAWCWGGNGSGKQLGDNTTTPSSFPVQVKGIGGAGFLSGVSKIDVGGYSSISSGNSCAVTSSGLVCWGSNYGSSNPTLTSLGSTPFQSISFSGGSNTVCGVTILGSYCQYGVAGSAGVGSSPLFTSTWNMVSVPTPSGLSISSVAAGSNHTCAGANGSTYCWGAGLKGALGNGSTANVLTTSGVRSVAGGFLTGISAVSAGATNGCGLSGASGLSCWGDNTFGNLGINSTTQSTTAVTVTGSGGIGTLSGITHHSSGYLHNCAVGTAGQVFCWGWDGSGQLGNNSTISSAVPLPVVGVGAVGSLTGMTKVAAGYAHTCALSGGGEVFCWGSNSHGQLGNNSTTRSTTPVKVLSVAGSGSLSGVTAIAAGGNHTCAVATGQVFCWGANSRGQLGDSSTTSALYPVGTLNSGFVGLTGIASISAGAEHTCAVSSSGTVFCWGDGTYGQLGNGDNTNATIAAQVVGIGGSGFLSSIASLGIGAGGYHTCALNILGSAIVCWGAGGSGQMGNNTTPGAQLTPVTATTAPAGVSYFNAR